MTISVDVEDHGGSFEVNYTVGARIAMKTSVNRPNHPGPATYNLEFRDLVLRGTVQLKPGEPVTLANQSGRKLSLTLIKGE